MSANIMTEKFTVDGMSCINCESRIENKLKAAAGIISVKASYAKASVKVTYDSNIIKPQAIEKLIASAGYKVRKNALAEKNADSGSKSKLNQLLGIGIIVFAAFTIGNYFGLFDFFNSFPQAKQGVGYGMLFVIGVLTSIHCVAMCGGINLSQCVPKSADSDSKFANLRPSILYNAGRVVSYTVVGGIVGGIGTVVSFSGAAKGVVAIVAGVFMVIMGLNMLNLFPWLRKFNLHMPKIFAQKINTAKSKNRSPFYIGLLNGLMPCGPLQAMQIYALTAGSAAKGALAMFLFSLGTVPLLFGLGALSTFLSKKFTVKMMQVSSVLVIVLGVFMFQNGVSLSGISLPASAVNNTDTSSSQSEAVTTDGVQTITTTLSRRGYEPITVQAGVPVRWILDAPQGTINGCNSTIIIPEFNLEIPLSVGENVIEFTPTEAGTIPFSCWMGMIRSQITVVDDLSAAPTAAVSQTVLNSQEELGAGCCEEIAG